MHALVARRLRNLRLVDRISVGMKCRNASQLRFNLTRLCASAIPNHWMRNLPPSVTEYAAACADELVSTSFISMLQGHLSPDARLDLAVAAARLPIAYNGYGLANYTATRHAAYTASFLTTWPIIARAIPTLAVALPRTSSFFGHLSTAYTHLQTTLSAVRTRFAALDRAAYHDVHGEQQTAYHPKLRDELSMPDFDTLTLDTDSNTKPLRQKVLSMVVNCACWIDLLDAANDFDSSNAGATVRHREARRVVSASQAGSGLFLLTSPDLSLPATTIQHDSFVSACQYRAGLYISRLAATLDERARRGVLVTQSDRLGDTAVNTTSTTSRHNRVNCLFHNAKRAATTATVQLGDKGDGSTAARAAALKRYAHLNATHVPDIIELGDVVTLSETKCWNSLKPSGALGNGSAANGGAPSTNEGHYLAFGCTLEKARWDVHGCAAFGDARPLDHASGVGRVDEHAGYYADAHAKGHRTELLLTEVLGGVHGDAVRMLRLLERDVKREGARDGTVYGRSRTAAKGFTSHWLRLISASIATSVGDSISLWADMTARSLLDAPDVTAATA